MMRIVHRRHEAICSLEPSAARPHGLRRQATAATAQPLPTTAALTNRRSAPTATRRPMTIADLRSRALTIRRPHALIRLRNPTPHRAAAIRLRRAPIPRRAPAIAAGVAAIGAVMAVVAAEARAAAGVPALTDTTNSFPNSIARPDLPDGLIVFRRHLQLNSPRLTSS